ncbi:hypothetical protein ACKKBG_A27805 [Auxenochlorella protothecoides x Auxenochlorella symbiontica]
MTRDAPPPGVPYENGSWASALAASLVVHAPMPEFCAKNLTSVFLGVDDIWVVLANGAATELEAIPVLERGSVCRGPLLADWPLPPGAPSLSRMVMDSKNVEELMGEALESAPDYSDLEELRRRGAVGWCQAAPLACDAPHATLLGALLLTGRGPRPTMDGAWLADWACEMAQTIAHASVQVMEASLDVLRVVFPPKVLEQLVAGAVRARSPSRILGLAAELAEEEVAPCPDARTGAEGAAEAASESPAVAQEGNAASGGAASGGAASGGAGQSGGSGGPAGPGGAGATPPRGGTPSPAPSHAISLDGSASSGAGPTPFAAAAGALRPWADGSGPAPPSRAGSAAAGPGDAAAVGARLGSAPGSLRLSRAGTASPMDMLRAGSLESDTSFLFDDALPWSPHSSELSGFEDLLAEDAAAHAQRRPSAALDRAYSRSSERDAAGRWGGSGSDPEAIAAAGSPHHSPDGPLAWQGAAAQAAATVAASQQQAGAAGGPPSPRSALGNRSPSQAQLAARLASIAEGSSGSLESSLGMGRDPRTRTLEAVAAGLAADALVAVHRSSTNDTSAGVAAEAAGSLESDLGASPPAWRGGVGAAAVLRRRRQRWNLAFVDADLEDGYEAWAAALALRADALAGALWVLALAAAVEGLVRGGSLLSLGGLTACLGLMALAIPAPLSFFHPTWWATHRLASVTLLRVVCCLACVVQVTIAEASVAGAGTLHELQRYACTLSMIMCSLCYPVPLAVHIPLQLACLWLTSAGYSLGSSSREGLHPLTLRLGAGFLASTWLTWWWEQAARRRFLRTSAHVEAAAAMSSEVSAAAFRLE